MFGDNANATDASGANGTSAAPMNISTQISQLNATVLAKSPAIQAEFKKIDDLEGSVTNATFGTWLNRSIEAQSSNLFKAMNLKFADVVKLNRKAVNLTALDNEVAEKRSNLGVAVGSLGF